MHLSYWMVLIAALMPVATIGSAKARKGYDNSQPRHWAGTLQGWQARADAAHRNHFEAFPAFAAAVIIAQQKASASQHMIDLLAVVFIVARIAYTFAYLGNQATLRTAIWGIGVACIIALFVI